MRNKQAYSIFKLLKIKRVGPAMINKILNEIPDTNDSLYDIVEARDPFEKLDPLFKSNQIAQLEETDTGLRNQNY